MVQSFRSKDCAPPVSIVDFMPIVTCKGKSREWKVAMEITLKGYCSTKNMYCYDIKLHTVGQRREGIIPFPEMIALTPASENELTVFKNECVPCLYGKTVLADKIYRDFAFFDENNPVKYLPSIRRLRESRKSSDRGKNRQGFVLTNRFKSQKVCRILFNWLNEKTEIQRAYKVRAAKGLLVHTFGKLAIALLTFVYF